MLMIGAHGLWLRLSSTLWLNDYLALNTDVEAVFQATDMGSRFLVLRLLAAAYSKGCAAKRLALGMLVLCAYGLWLRLSSTLGGNGYLALNTAGVFQATDVCSLFLVLRLLAAAYSAGYTAKRIALEMLVLCAYGLWLCLSSTLWSNGYLALNTAG